MPFLRFSRDRRGYETTYLMHAFHRRSGNQPRILYFFRTPPNAKCGRAALDEEAIRAIEESNPELEFDWPNILKSSPEKRETARSAASGGPPARSSESVVRPSTRKPDQPAPRAARGKRSGPPQRATPTSPTNDLPTGAGHEEEGERAEQRPRQRNHGAAEQFVPFTREEPQSGDQAADESGPELEPFPAALAVESLQGEGVESLDGEESAEGVRAAHATEQSAAEAALGTEGLARLRARFAEISARISERVTDPARLEALRAQAEHLNPDAWVTADEVRNGLEQYETVYHSLRSVVGFRQSRRGGRRRRPARP